MVLLGNALLLILGNVLLLGILVAVKTNLVPGEVEQVIHALQAATTCLRNRDQDPKTTNEGDGGEAPEGTLGRDTTVAGGEKHVGNSAGVAVLVGEVQSHGPRGGQGTNSEREQLGSEEVLHGVPAQSPTESRDVDHGNGTSAGTLVGLGEDKVIINAHLGNTGEEGSDVEHGNGLEGDAGEKSSLSANDIDEEEGADQGSAELDNTKDGSDKKRLVGTSNTKKAEKIRGVEGDRAGSGPLRKELHHAGEVEAVQVAGDEEHLLELAEGTDTLGGLELVVEGVLDRGDLSDDVLAVNGLLTHAGQDHGSLVGLVLLHEESGGLGLEEHEDQDDSRHHDVQAGGHQPSVVSVLGHVDGAAIVREVCQHDADVDGTSEEACAETSNRGGSHLSDINRTAKS